MLAVRTRQGHNHGAIIGRVKVPHAVAGCDEGTLGYFMKHYPGDVCGMVMRAVCFVEGVRSRPDKARSYLLP